MGKNGVAQGQFVEYGDGGLQYGKNNDPELIAKGIISTDGAGGAAIVGGGEGIDAVAISGTRVLVTLSDPQPDALMTAQAMPHSTAAADPDDVCYGMSGATQSTLLIGALTGSTGAALDLSANAVQFALDIFRAPT